MRMWLDVVLRAHYCGGFWVSGVVDIVLMKLTRSLSSA